MDMPKKWTALEKGPSIFQSYYLILDKFNAITAESLENKTVKFYPQCHRDFANDTKLNRILNKQTNEKEESLTEVTVGQHQDELLDIRITVTRIKSRKKKSVLLVTKKTNKKKRSRHWEILRRVESDDV